MKFLRKNWGNLLMVLIIMAIIFPQTRMPIQVFLQRTFSMSPSEIESDNRETLIDYNWPLTDLDGNDHNLSDSKNDVIVLNFWATWCAPCIAELPSMQRLYDQFGDRVKFYFVSPEESGTVLKFIESKGYSIPVYLEVSQPPSLLQINTIPTTFVMNRQGEIVIQKTGSAKWDSDKTITLMNQLLID